MGNNILGPPSNYAAITALQNDKMDKSANLSDVADDVISFGNIKQDATTDATGVVELATDAEVESGTSGVIPDAAQIAANYNINGRKGIGTFAGSTGVSIDITDYAIGTTSYHVDITLDDLSGYIGEISVESKAENSFVVKNSGSDTTTTFTWSLTL